MSDRVVVVCSDLLFWSRIVQAAREAGRTAVRVDDDAGMESALAAGAGAVIVDLGSPPVDPFGWAQRWRALPQPPRLIAFGSHVDRELLGRASEAGFDPVLPRSRFVRDLPALLQG